MKIKWYKYFLLFILALLSCKDKSVEPINTPNNESYIGYVVAYDTPGEGNVYIYSTSTKSLVKVTANVVDTSYFAYVSSFSDDGHELLFTLDYRKPGKEDWLFCDRDDIFLYSLISGKVTRITNTDYREANPRFSKDGKYIIYESYETGRSSICMIDKYGTNRKVLVSNSGFNHSPHFLMNDQKILYTSYRDGKSEFYLNDISGGNEEQLTTNNLGGDVSISSTSNFFLFSAKDGIYKYDFTSKDITLVLDGNSGVKMNYDPIVSNDSKYIVYKYFDGSWIYNRIMTIDGKLLIDLGKGFAADITKDSKNIVSLQTDGMHLFNIYSQKDSVLLPYQILSFDMVVSSIK